MTKQDKINQLEHELEIESQESMKEGINHTSNRGWEKKFDKEFLGKDKSDMKGKNGWQIIQNHAKNVWDIKNFIRDLLTKEYVKGYKNGSGGIVADTMALKEQFEAGATQKDNEWRKRIEELRKHSPFSRCESIRIPVESYNKALDDVLDLLTTKED